jgi:CRISPR/Cas system endoribonuclease Cas6 (RAMP superfamily)
MTMKQTPIMKFTTAYKVTLPQGENKTRFSLRFTDKTLAVKETAIINDIVISHQKNSNTLAVHNSSTDIIIQKVVLYYDWTVYQHLEGRKSIARGIQLPLKK